MQMLLTIKAVSEHFMQVMQSKYFDHTQGHPLSLQPPLLVDNNQKIQLIGPKSGLSFRNVISKSSSTRMQEYFIKIINIWTYQKLNNPSTLQLLNFAMKIGKMILNTSSFERYNEPYFFTSETIYILFLDSHIQENIPTPNPLSSLSNSSTSITAGAQMAILIGLNVAFLYWNLF